MAREADHLAVLCAAWVGTPRREIGEHINGGDEERVATEEDLRVGRRLVREEGLTGSCREAQRARPQPLNKIIVIPFLPEGISP